MGTSISGHWCRSCPGVARSRAPSRPGRRRPGTSARCGPRPGNRSAARSAIVTGSVAGGPCSPSRWPPRPSGRCLPRARRSAGARDLDEPELPRRVHAVGNLLLPSPGLHLRGRLQRAGLSGTGVEATQSATRCGNPAITRGVTVEVLTSSRDARTNTHPQANVSYIMNVLGTGNTTSRSGRGWPLAGAVR